MKRRVLSKAFIVTSAAVAMPGCFRTTNPPPPPMVMVNPREEPQKGEENKAKPGLPEAPPGTAIERDKEGRCWAPVTDFKCPDEPGVSCNPPGPREVKCPPKQEEAGNLPEASNPRFVHRRANGSCYEMVEMKCPPPESGMTCNPPPPRDVKCPKLPPATAPDKVFKGARGFCFQSRGGGAAQRVPAATRRRLSAWSECPPGK